MIQHLLKITHFGSPPIQNYLWKSGYLSIWQDTLGRGSAFRKGRVPIFRDCTRYCDRLHTSSALTVPPPPPMRCSLLIHRGDRIFELMGLYTGYIKISFVCLSLKIKRTSCRLSIMLSWIVTSCRIVSKNQSFGETYWMLNMETVRSCETLVLTSLHGALTPEVTSPSSPSWEP